MSGVSIKIEDGGVRAALERLEGNLDRKAELLDAIGATARQDVWQNFEDQASPAGIPWAPLKPATLKRRGAGAQILRDRGNLYKSMTYRVTGDDTVEVGTNLVYAGVHQFGGSIKREAREQVVHFRFAAEGAGKDGKGSRLRFTKAGGRHAEGAYARKVSIGGYTINIPARPFLGVGPRLVERLNETLVEALAP
ncbi:phage virion morphogenesis protein [Zavarzinia aquatilis]|uniref:Phage virion morphogenesis protein n=1 Tax=Zavarzinia aquatilis TaxID=2211142 RepID=A0A317DSI7_9PROT|nr:phage virion morphogenesis protein [Zavarzinia aquatilis]PWR17637.1 phage virion morphogenesis protein [Zavarzinia aquatilis]